MLRAGLGSGCLLAIIATSSARADLLNLELLDFPDIFSGFIDVMYDAGTDQFTATGFALTFDGDGGSQENITGGVFTIAGTIMAGGVFSSGSLTVEGDVSGFGTTLLTADVVDFGFLNGGGDLFEFLFEVTGGDLAIAEFYGGPGTIVGVILDANFGGTGFNGSFDQDFNNNDGIPGFGLGVSDTAPIPGPSALLVLLAAGGLGARQRRRRR